MRGSLASLEKGVEREVWNEGLENSEHRGRMFGLRFADIMKPIKALDLGKESM